MSIIEPRLLKGFRDTFAEGMHTRKHLISIVEQVLANYGFQPLETPSLEYADILLGKLGDEGEKLLYQFTDHGQRQVAMRYDFTVPLARVVAQYPDLPKPFKRYQVGPVWRADNTQKGRYREFYQFDMDIVGSDSRLADAEILVVMQQSLLNLGINDFTIKVNDRKLLAELAETSGLSNSQSKTFYTGLDKWDKIGQNGVQEYWQQHQLSSKQVETLTIAVNGSLQISDGLKDTLHFAQDLGLDSKHVVVDPTIVRGLDYYTGIVFETILTKAPQYGSVFSGGRYDNLIGRFSKQEIPAVGASIGLDRLIAAMEELNIVLKADQKTQVFVTVFNADLEKPSIEIVSQLRQANIATEISYQSQHLGKQLKYASARSIPWAVIIGPEEADQKIVTLRNLQDGQEQKLSVDQLIRHFVSSL